MEFSYVELYPRNEHQVEGKKLAGIPDSSQYPEGAVFFVRPTQHSQPLGHFNDTLGAFGLGVTETGPGYGQISPLADGTYEVRTFGPGGTDGLAKVLEHEGWEVGREQSWQEFGGGTEPTGLGKLLRAVDPGAERQTGPVLGD